MNDTFKFITQEIVAVLSAFLGAYCGYRFARLRETETIKIAYRVRIQAVIAQIPPRNVPQFHSETRGSVKDSVLAVLSYLSENKAIGLTKLWKQYDNEANLEFDARELDADWVLDLYKIENKLYQTRTPLGDIVYNSLD